MAKPDPVEIYIERALQAGMGHATIRAELDAAGWPARDVETALGAWAERGDGATDRPPVPRPQVRFSFMDMLGYLLLLGALGTVAFNAVTLTFGLLDYLLPDDLDSRFRWRAQSARWLLATLIVAAPIYGGMSWWIAKDLARSPHKHGAAVRRGALGLMLFVSAVVLAGNAVTVTYAFLSGEVTLRFILKVLTVALVAGGVLLIARDDLNVGGRGMIKRGVHGLGAALVLGLVVWTVTATGTPPAARAAELDQRRFNDLQELANGLRCSRTDGVLPMDPGTQTVVSYCNRGYVVPLETRDPVTQQPYAFERLSDTGFRICATFSDPGRDFVQWRNSDEWAYDPQTGCLTGLIR